jgi:hypothetical protein
MMEPADNFSGKFLLSFSFDGAICSDALLIHLHVRRVSKRRNRIPIFTVKKIVPAEANVSGTVISKSNAGRGQFHTYA